MAGGEKEHSPETGSSPFHIEDAGGVPHLQPPVHALLERLAFGNIIIHMLDYMRLPANTHHHDETRPQHLEGCWPTLSEVERSVHSDCSWTPGENSCQKVNSVPSPLLFV